MAAIDYLLQDLADSLAEVPEMAGAKIVVDRQSNLRKIATAAVAKASGFACFLDDTGGSNDHELLDKPRINLGVTLELVFKAIVSEVDNCPPRDVFEAVLAHVQKLTLHSRPHYPKAQFSWKTYRKDTIQGFLIYTINLDTTIQIT